MALKGYKKIRVIDFVKKRPLHVLIDSGSTHNLLDNEMAKTLGCKTMDIRPVSVDVTNGGS